MATWEDSESGSEKEEAGDEANVVVALVATLTSEVEPDSDSEDENEVHSKIPKEELVGLVNSPWKYKGDRTTSSLWKELV